MAVVPLDVMEEDWDLAGSSQADIAPRVGGTAVISCNMIVNADFNLYLLVELLHTDPTGLGVIEV